MRGDTPPMPPSAQRKRPYASASSAHSAVKGSWTVNVVGGPLQLGRLPTLQRPVVIALFFTPNTASCCRRWRSCTSCGAGRSTYWLFDHPDWRRPSARWRILRSRSFPTPGSCASRFRRFPAASESRNCSWPSSTIRRSGTTRSSAICYLDDKQYVRARECLDRVVSASNQSPDPFYRRALCCAGDG